MPNIPVYAPTLDGNEKRYVDQCLESSWISSRGEFIDRFENAFGQFIGVDHCVAVSNGTVALHVALEALGIGPGDEVIVPTLTYIASVNVIAQVGAVPVLVDSVASTWQLDPEQVRKRINSRTKAIMAVHLYGQACEMETLVSLARAHQLFLIEDCAEAIGTRYRGQHVGRFGDIAAFSFYGNKTITTGEGGMVASNSSTLAARVRHLKSQGMAPDRTYWHDTRGYNYRMTNICAAIGLAQMEQITRFLTRKRAIALQYQAALRGLPLIFHAEAPDTTHSFWMCSIALDDPAKRDALRTHLAERGIDTRPVFFPAHIMPVFYEDEAYPVAESLASRGINLPSWPGLSDGSIDLISNSIREFF